VGSPVKLVSVLVVLGREDIRRFYLVKIQKISPGGGKVQKSCNNPPSVDKD